MRKIKILFTFSINIMLNIFIGYGQDFKVLQIGDTIPDAFYKEVVKLGTTGKIFSESKEELIILDFWNTYCGTCIESLPKMKSLQEEFENKIQLFLVNASEDSLQIMNRMSLPSLRKYKVNLPIIANAKVFKELFPYKFVPHHVWIDKEGIVRMIGSPLNTNSKKIGAFLKGEKISSLNGPNNSLVVDENTSLHRIARKNIKGQDEISSVFSSHNNHYSASSPMIFEGIIDSVYQRVKDTYINNDIMELYRSVFFDDISSKGNKQIYSGLNSLNSNYWRDFFILEVVDTIAVASSYVSYLERTDEEYTQSRYCYEQLLPKGYSGLERRSHMLKNLNQYFGGKLGIKGELVEQELLCYVLRSKYPDNIPNSSYGKTPLNSALSYRVFQLLSKSPDSYLKFMIDETGIETVDGLELPDKEYDFSFEDIELALNKLGISVKQEKRIIRFIRIKDI